MDTGTDSAHGKPEKSKNAQEPFTGPKWVIFFIGAALLLGIPSSVTFVLSDSDHNGLERLLAVGAMFLVLGTVTQMTLAWVDPVGRRESKRLDKRTESLESKRAEAVDKEVEKANGPKTIEFLTTAGAPGSQNAWRHRMAYKFRLRNLRKSWKTPAHQVVDEEHAEDIDDLKSRKFGQKSASLAWALLAVGSTMLAFGAWYDLLVEGPPSNPAKCVVTVEAPTTHPTTFSCEVTTEEANSQPSQ